MVVRAQTKRCGATIEDLALQRTRGPTRPPSAVANRRHASGPVVFQHSLNMLEFQGPDGLLDKASSTNRHVAVNPSDAPTCSIAPGVAQQQTSSRSESRCSDGDVERVERQRGGAWRRGIIRGRERASGRRVRNRPSRCHRESTRLPCVGYGRASRVRGAQQNTAQHSAAQHSTAHYSTRHRTPSAAQRCPRRHNIDRPLVCYLGGV